MRRRMLFAVLVCLASTLHAAPARCQGTGRSLDIQPGARENGMGAAGVALIGDPTDGLWWNPAMLAFGRRPGVGVTYAKLVPGLANDVKYWNGGATVPIGGIAGAGFAYTRLSFGSLTGGTFHAEETTPAVSAGIRVTPDFAFGATMKFVDIALAPGFDGSTSGFDLGVLYRYRVSDVTLSAAATLNNIGPGVTFSPFDAHEPLTRNVRAGLAARYIGPSTPEGFVFGAAFAVDRFQSVLPGGKDANYATTHYGGEFSLGMRHILRLAMRAGYYDDPEGQIGDVTFGVGGRVVGLTVDFASIPQARDSGLDRVKKWTFGYHFDPLH